MDGKVEILDQDDANLADLVGLGETKDGKSKPITIEKVDSVSVPPNAAVASTDNEEANDDAKVVKTSFISTGNKSARDSNASSDIDEIAIVDVAAGEIKLPGAKSTTGEVKVEEEKHKLIDSWTFWYVYSMSHRDKKKIKQVRKNEYELREVYSFETVSRFNCA